MGKRDRYFQFCPVAKAAEILGERWTLLVLREMLVGSRRFNDLRRGVPRMSQSLLSRRLKALEAAGIVEHAAGADGTGGEYRLSPAGQELRPIIEAIGAWGYRWVTPAVTPDDLDATLLAWDMRRRMNVGKLPFSPLVIHFHYVDAPREFRRIWMLWEHGEMDVCLDDPGRPVNVEVTTDLRTMTLIWLGDAPYGEALRRGLVTLEGPDDLCRAFPDWLGLSSFAGLKRAGGPLPLAAHAPGHVLRSARGSPG